MVVLLSLVAPLALSSTGSIASAATNAEEETQAASSSPASAQVEQEDETLGPVVEDLEMQSRRLPPPGIVFICRTVRIQSRANGRFVSAELGYSGINYAMLRARATVVGPWERFRLCYHFNNGTYTFFALSNNRYVSAELGYSGSNYAMLRARATVIGPWERFHLQSFGTYVTIRSAANNQLVSAELGYPGIRYAMLRARATVVGPWEQFQ
jgi:hypothetical protein